MRRMIRPHIAAKYGPCIDCGSGTRSHVLEAAEYESYEGEIVIDRSDDFASKEWEEVDTVTKYALTDSAVVICHKCWSKKTVVFQKIIDDNFTKWEIGGMSSIRPIMKVLKSIRYLQIEFELDAPTRSKIRELRVMSKSLLTTTTGDEEE